MCDILYIYNKNRIETVIRHYLSSKMQIDTTKSRATGDKASARKELKKGASIAKVADEDVNEELAR